MNDPDRFAGCLLGLALGDSMGAPFEGGIVERLLWRLIGRTANGESRWTDDTQMTLDLADSFIARGELDQDDAAARLAAGYRWTRGYGPGAAKLLKRIRHGSPWREANRSVYAEGSFGNGAATRSPVIALMFPSQRDRLIAAARQAAMITHAHPLGIEGAVMIAVATAAALSSRDILGEASGVCELNPFVERLNVVRMWMTSNTTPTASEVRDRLGNGIAAHESCVTALYLALRCIDGPFDDVVHFAIACGGDVDTIAAMAGAIWGAANGASKLPQKALCVLEDRERIRATAMALTTK